MGLWAFGAGTGGEGEDDHGVYHDTWVVLTGDRYWDHWSVTGKCWWRKLVGKWVTSWEFRICQLTGENEGINPMQGRATTTTKNLAAASLYLLWGTGEATASLYLWGTGEATASTHLFWGTGEDDRPSLQISSSVPRENIAKIQQDWTHSSDSGEVGSPGPHGPAAKPRTNGAWLLKR
ncbi:hypothetical protein MMC17_006625 [Xylographa soralifera]|nr:hypothetical protein [Xylographa soralifera]